MAHDPTRAWPLGIGPDQTAIPGAAWLELLDGQAFPVVGAGAMVWNGNVWTPASSSNPLHTRDAALASLIGALNAAKETNPDAASASMLALLRGMLATFGKETTLAAVRAAAESRKAEPVSARNMRGEVWPRRRSSRAMVLSRAICSSRAKRAASSFEAPRVRLRDRAGSRVAVAGARAAR